MIIKEEFREIRDQKAKCFGVLMRCKFCNAPANNVYETEAPIKIFSCDKKACVKKAQEEADKWRR